jgi:hypothetical protein
MSAALKMFSEAAFVKPVFHLPGAALNAQQSLTEQKNFVFRMVIAFRNHAEAKPHT